MYVIRSIFYTYALRMYSISIIKYHRNLRNIYNENYLITLESERIYIINNKGPNTSDH